MAVLSTGGSDDVAPLHLHYFTSPSTTPQPHIPPLLLYVARVWQSAIVVLLENYMIVAIIIWVWFLLVAFWISLPLEIQFFDNFHKTLFYPLLFSLNNLQMLKKRLKFLYFCLEKPKL